MKYVKRFLGGRRRPRRQQVRTAEPIQVAGFNQEAETVWQPTPALSTHVNEMQRILLEPPSPLTVQDALLSAYQIIYSMNQQELMASPRESDLARQLNANLSWLRAQIEPLHIQRIGDLENNRAEAPPAYAPIDPLHGYEEDETGSIAHATSNPQILGAIVDRIQNFRHTLVWQFPQDHTPEQRAWASITDPAGSNLGALSAAMSSVSFDPGQATLPDRGIPPIEPPLPPTRRRSAHNSQSPTSRNQRLPRLDTQGRSSHGRSPQDQRPRPPTMIFADPDYPWPTSPIETLQPWAEDAEPPQNLQGDRVPPPSVAWDRSAHQRPPTIIFADPGYDYPITPIDELLANRATQSSEVEPTGESIIQPHKERPGFYGHGSHPTEEEREAMAAAAPLVYTQAPRRYDERGSSRSNNQMDFDRSGTQNPEVTEPVATHRERQGFYGHGSRGPTTEERRAMAAAAMSSRSQVSQRNNEPGPALSTVHEDFYAPGARDPSGGFGAVSREQMAIDAHQRAVAEYEWNQRNQDTNDYDEESPVVPSQYSQGFADMSPEVGAWPGDFGRITEEQIEQFRRAGLNF